MNAKNSRPAACSTPQVPSVASSARCHDPGPEQSDALGSAYAANVIAIAAQEAVFPTTKPPPARKPHHGPSTSRPKR